MLPPTMDVETEVKPKAFAASSKIVFDVRSTQF